MYNTYNIYWYRHKYLLLLCYIYVIYSYFRLINIIRLRLINKINVINLPMMLLITWGCWEIKVFSPSPLYRIPESINNVPHKLQHSNIKMRINNADNKTHFTIICYVFSSCIDDIQTLITDWYRHIIKVFMYPATYYHLLLIFFNKYKCDRSILFLDFLKNCTVKCFNIAQPREEKPDKYFILWHFWNIFHQICWKDGQIYLLSTAIVLSLTFKCNITQPCP